jgi:hypothetical protein
MPMKEAEIPSKSIFSAASSPIVKTAVIVHLGNEELSDGVVKQIAVGDAS